MTTAEAAAVLGVKPQTVARAILRGYLKATKHGRDYWIEPVDLEHYKAQQTGGRRKKGWNDDRSR